MDSFKFHDIRVEKANAISRHRTTQRITTLFRFVELSVFLIILSRYSTQFATFSLKLSGEYFRGISVTLISPRFVFLVGNAIVIVLFLISGKFSAKKGEKITDFYDEYVEKLRSKQEKKAYSEYDYNKSSVCYDEKKIISRSQSQIYILERPERRRDLMRSVSESCRKSVDYCGRKAAAAAVSENEMSSEEFRRTVEAFIARQQRFLREEEEGFNSAVVSFQS